MDVRRISAPVFLSIGPAELDAAVYPVPIPIPAALDVYAEPSGGALRILGLPEP
jgi:hypothetical protein